ncbi:MAG: hypothetical protein UZ21_OP11001000052 [Microgenomates bacterium OLB22]|nr:MAG: hypothetical protein UZ21_OP11001000052 [Microgenomates bacterium OLB22]
MYEAFSEKVSVIIETTLRDKAWINQTIIAARDHGYRIEMTYVHRSMDECLKNIFQLRKRIVPLSFFVSAIGGLGTLEHYLNDPVLDRLIIKDVTGLFNPSAAPQIWYQRETDTVVHDGAETLTQMWQDHVTFLPLFEK